MTSFPKISIVTPSFNDAPFLEQTIQSVVSQNYPNLEYIIIDGGSNDGSVEIIKRYEKFLTYWVSERDNGMYHAIQKGFEKVSGDIMGWVNSDDVHHPQSLFTIAQIFSDFREVNWIQGLPNVIDEKGRIVHAVARPHVDKFFFYSHKHIASRGYIQQESSFWRKELWEKTGRHVSQEYRYAGDFELWIRFFQVEKLYTLTAPLGGFRLSRDGQASREHYQEYVRETMEVLKKFPLSKEEQQQMRRLNFYSAAEKKVRDGFGFLKNRLTGLKSSVESNRIFFDGVDQKFKMK